MGNISDKICRENQNTYFMFTDFLFLNNLGVYEIICTNMGVRQETEDKIMWRMRFACWITKVTHTHTHTHTQNTDIPGQKWSGKRGLTSRLTYIVYLVYFFVQI